jgi:Ribbon-helix-helix domain
MKSPVIKRTVYIDGRKTGVSIEDAFWSTLKEIAHAQGATVSQTVTEIDKLRQGEPYLARSACSCSTGSVQKKWGPPWGKTAAPNRRRQLRGMETGADSST